MKRKWIKIMIGLIILTGFALVPKERSSKVAGEPKNFLGVYDVGDTIKIQIVGYDQNLKTNSSSLMASDVTTWPEFSNKSLGQAVTSQRGGNLCPNAKESKTGGEDKCYVASWCTS